MRIALIILIGIHGIIHLLGFLKAFDIGELNAIPQPISKIYGVFWFLTFFLFALTIVLNLVHSDFWWLTGLLAVVISQVLIFHYWSDARFGTIANVIILFATIIGYSTYNFEHKIKGERKDLFASSKLKSQGIITMESLDNVPPIIQKWLINSGVIGCQPVFNVYLTQELQIRLRPDQENWNNGKAEQYFTTQPPAFNWNICTEMNSMLSIVGRDKFYDGKGEMIIKLFSLFPVANTKNDKKINQATMQRYLAEIVWFPSASLSQYIKWETIDDHSARAIMEYKGTKVSGEFHFDKNGSFEKFVAMRYKNSSDEKPYEWTVTATKIEERQGIKIPVECEVTWELENEKWTWLKLKITDVEYNVKEMPIADNVCKE